MKGILLRRLPAVIAGRLRDWRLRRILRSFPARVVEHSYGRHRFRIHIPDPMSLSWYDGDTAEPAEISLLREHHLIPGARVFNLGAHQGVVAMMLAGEVGREGQVVAVEPVPHNCATAAKNVALNDLPQIRLVQAAVADRCGSLTLNGRLNGQLDDGTGSEGRLLVESVTVDSLADRFGLPDVVFMDIEGAESLALAAARRVIGSGADFFVEVHAGCGLEKLGGSVSGVLSYFPASRFEILGRAEQDAAYRPLHPGDPLTRDRFFLLALARSGRLSAGRRSPWR